MKFFKKLKDNGGGPDGPSSSLFPRSLMLALEPRLLYDAAGLITVAESSSMADGSGAAHGGDTSGDSSPSDGHDANPLADLAPPATGEETNSDRTETQDHGLTPPEPDDAGTSHSLIFVSRDIQDLDSLLQGLDPDSEVIFLDSGTDGVDQITRALEGYQDLDAVVIFSHGLEGEAVLGTASLSLSTLDGYAGQLSAWGDALGENADILFYGCSMGSGTAGETLVDRIAEITGADVAASDDPTGAASLGGDWDLETESGDIEAAAPLDRETRDSYAGLMAAPAAPSTPDLTAASDTGQHDTDNITKDNTPTFSGTAEANATVTLYDGATSIGTATADGSGNWSITASALADGDHTITATATNGDGTSAASSGLTVTIDTVAPSKPVTGYLVAAYDTGISNTDGITNRTGVKIVFGSTEYVKDTVTFSGASSFLGVSPYYPAASSYTYPFNLGVGTTTIYYTQTDVAGNESVQSDTWSITVDTTAPATVPGTPDLVAASDTGSSTTDNITNDTTPTFEGTGATAGEPVGVYADGILLGTTTADGSGNWSYTHATDLAGGTYSITARTMDAAGNTSADSPALAITVDATTPAAPGTPDLSASSDSGSSSTDNITNDTTPTFTGTAEANSQVSVYDGATLLGTVAADGSGNWSYTSSALTEGAHSITARATDAAGNTSTASSALTVTIDTTAPAAQAALDLLASGDSGISSTDNITNISSPAFLFNLTEAGKVTIHRNSSSFSGIPPGAGLSTSAIPLQEGANNIYFTLTDVAGNISAPSPTLTVTLDTTAPTTAPGTPDLAASSDTGTSSTDNITKDTTPTFTGTAVAGDLVALYDGATLLGTTTADGSGNWSYTASALANGSHSITARTMDTAGNTSAASSTLTITVDTTAPSTPSTPDLLAASDSGSSSTDNITSDTTPTLTGTAEANAEISVYDGATLLGTTTANGSGDWSYTPSALAEGAHTITVRATDTAGNVSSASTGLTVTVDTTAPAAPGAPDLSASSDSGSSPTDNITSDTTPTLTGTADANAEISVYDGATLLGTTTANGAGNWSYTPSALADGAHTITVRATDTAGNVSSASTGLTVTVDTTAPAVTDGNISITGATGNGGAFKVGDTVTATWDNSGSGDNNSDVASVTMDFSEFGGPSAVTATLSSGVWQAVFTITEDGGGIIEADNRNVSVTATDTAGNVRTVQDDADATVDNNTPEAPTATLAVDEQVPDGTVVGTVSSIGADTYTLVDDAGGRFTIDAATGELSVVDGQALDFEALQSHTIVVRAEDAAGNSVETALVVAINDVFDDPAQNPSPTTNAASPGSGPAGTSFVPAGVDTPGGSSWTPPGSLPGFLSTGEGGQGPGLIPGPAEGFEESGESIPDVTLASTETLEFGIPKDAFSPEVPAAEFTYEITLADGSPLPEWVSFDPATQVFTVSPEGEFSGELTVLVVARDTSGMEIRTTFTIMVTPEAGQQAAGLSHDGNTGPDPATRPDQPQAPEVVLGGQDTILAALTAGVIPAAGFAAPARSRGLSARISHAAGRFDRGLKELLARVV